MVSIVLEIDVKITHACTDCENEMSIILPVVITVDEVLDTTVGVRVRVTPNDKIK